MGRADSNSPERVDIDSPERVDINSPERVDLNSREQVEILVDQFYERILADPVLAPIFLDVAAVDLAVHLPHIKDYWSKLLLGERSYQRHTMNIHRSLHGKRRLDAGDFQRWLTLFQQAVDEGWSGPKADRAKQLGRAIAANMQESLFTSR
ncbi:MAG: group III truncated hemoglobin [Halieaceae bacterium]